MKRLAGSVATRTVVEKGTKDSPVVNGIGAAAKNYRAKAQRDEQRELGKKSRQT